MTEEIRGVLELEITPLDPYYYVSRESGTTFSTKPYIMHTALYYALGLLPTRFRITEQSPSYEDHFKEALGTDGSYIYPAVAVSEEQFTTRRFAVKGDAFRTEAVQENKNLVETGHQRFVDPEVRFQTFALCQGNLDPSSFEDRLPSYIRVGKKMTTARLRTDIHRVDVQSGDFQLGQPIGRTDIPSDRYDVLGNIRTEPMAPVDLITECKLRGPHVRIKPRYGRRGSGSVALPTKAHFLGSEQ